MKKKTDKDILFERMEKVDPTFKRRIDEEQVPIEPDENGEEFTPHGTYTVSNAGGYEIMLSDSGDAAKVRDAFGSDNPETSDWLEIEYVPNEETGESEPVIDPNGYNIPLNQVMRINEKLNENYNVGDKFKDKEGNEFVINDFVKDGVKLAGERGEKEVAYDDLKKMEKIKN